MKTRQEVNDLKASWLGDPCWDIYNTEGFEEYEDELRQYQTEQKAEWRQKYQDEIQQLADDLGVHDNLNLALGFRHLSDRINELQDRIARLTEGRD